MKRSIVLPIAVAAVLAVAGALVVPAATGASNDTASLATQLEQALEQGELAGAAPAGRSLSTASAGAEPDWLYGPVSKSYYLDPITWLVLPYTMDWVAYWGAEDATYPRVGDLYYGRVVVGNVTNIEAYPIVDVVLPPNTRFDIASTDASRKIRCYLWDYVADPNGESFEELTGTSCPSQPAQGFYGANLNAASAWTVEPGKALIVDFPLRSTSTLTGIAGPHCLVAAIKVGFYDDVPPAGAKCPLADNNGAYQGVFVAPKAAADDATAPVLKVAAAGRQKLRAVLKTGVKSKATVDEAATIRTELRLPAKLARKLGLPIVAGKAKRELAAAGTVSVGTKFTNKAKRKLSKLRSFKVVLRTTALDAAKNKTVVDRTITVRR